MNYPVSLRSDDHRPGRKPVPAFKTRLVQDYRSGLQLYGAWPLSRARQYCPNHRGNGSPGQVHGGIAMLLQHGEIPPVGTLAVMGPRCWRIRYRCQCLLVFGMAGLSNGLFLGAGLILSLPEPSVRRVQGEAVRFCNVDATGIGAGVAPHMKTLGCRANAVKVAASPTEKTELGEFKNLRSQLWWACREWLRTDTGAMLPPDENLLGGTDHSNLRSDQRQN